MPRKLIFVVGTRAQLIKVAPVLVACERLQLTTYLLMTGQHRETMQDLLEEFGITSAQLSALPAAEHATVGSLLRWLPVAYCGIMARLREISANRKDTDVLVHGDTLSTLLGALAGRRIGARVVHLESGLTSGKLLDPFPEELCRRLVFRLTQIAMCPNAQTAEYMRCRYRAQVFDTGTNTIADAVALTGASASACDTDSYLVVSLHRFQNLYSAPRLSYLVELLEVISVRYPVRFVLHPATRSRLVKNGMMKRLISAPGIQLMPRMGYRDFLRMAAAAACVLTDGGSNQEELAVLGVPTVIMRERTERTDGLGANAMMEADAPEGIKHFIMTAAFEQLRRPPTVPYGNGPSHLIANLLAGIETEPV